MKQSVGVLKYLRTTERRGVALLWGLGLVIALLELVLPAQARVLTNLFQQEAADPTWSQINRAVAALIVAQLAVSLLTFVQKRRTRHFEQDISEALVKDVFSRLVRFSNDFFRDRDVESINTRTLEDTRVVSGVWTQILLVVPAAITSLLVFSVYMIVTNWFLGLCMIPLALLSGYFLFFDRVIQELNREVLEQWDGVRVRANELVTGVAEIRNHAAFDYGVRTVTDQYGGLSEVNRRFGSWRAFFEATGPFLHTFQNATLYWLGAGLCLAGSQLSQLAGPMSWGDVIAFLIIAGRFQDPVYTVAEFILQWRISRENIHRLNDYLGRPLEFEDRPDAPPLNAAGAPIVFDDVSLVTSTGSTILDRFNSRIEPGSHVALVGSAGCGKSTAMKLIVRGATPTSGSLRLADRTVDAYDLNALAFQVGFVPQQATVFQGTIRQNLLLSLRRPSRRSLRDADGDLDASTLGEFPDRRELDRLLLQVVRQVDFERDVFTKALDARLPNGRGFAALTTSIGRLRADAETLLRERRADLVMKFQEDQYLPVATLRENLLGPGATGTPAGDDSWLFQFLRKNNLLLPLLRLGFRRLLDDRSLAAQLARRASGLATLLSIEYATAPSFDRLSDARLGELTQLPDDQQASLLSVALDTDASTASEMPDAASLCSAVLETRRLLRGRQSGAAEMPDRWPTANESSYCENLSLRENLLLGRPDRRLYRATDECDALLYDLLKSAGVLDAVLLAGLEYPVGEGGKFLSGGQRQKMALARVLLKRPQILLLDEATASLDERSQSRIVETLGREFRGRTVVSITHRLSTVLDYDRLLFLERGQIVQEGAPRRLLEEAGPFQELAAQDGLTQKSSEQKAGPSSESDGSPGPQSAGAQPESILAVLRECDLFAGLAAEQLRAVAKVAALRTCPAGTILFHRGDDGRELFVVVEGTVEFFVEKAVQGVPDNQTEVVDTCGAGDVFGELALFGSGQRTLGAVTKDASQLIVFERETVVDLISSDPEIGLKFLCTLSRRIAAIRDEAYGPS